MVPEMPVPKAFHMPEEDPLDAEIKKFFADEGLKANEQTSTTTSLVRDILLHEQAVAGTQQDITAATNARLEIDKAKVKLTAEYNKQLKALEEAREEANERVFELRRELTKLKDSLEKLRKELRMHLDKLRQTNLFKSAITEYDRVTEGLYWRERAFGMQIEGAQLLALGERCILGDDMGLGKTLTLLIACDMSQAKKVLIICPADVTKNFEDDAKLWAGHRPIVSMYKMPPATRRAFMDTLKYLDEFTILINYDSWRKDKFLADSLASVGFDTVICDEGHNIKNSATSAFKGVKTIVLSENICPRCSSLNIEQKERDSKYFFMKCNDCPWDSETDYSYNVSERRSVKRFYFATGTPILNRPDELYPALHLMLPEVFTDIRFFREEYCFQDFNGHWKFTAGGHAKLKQHLGGRYIARREEELKKEGIEIPRQRVKIHEMDIDPADYPKQYKIIQELHKNAEFILESGKGIQTFHKIELILRQRQANIWPGGISLKDGDGNVVWSVGEEVTESIKIDWAVKMLEDFDTYGHRSVMFSQFSSPLHEIHRRLVQLGIRAVVFDGQTPNHIRDAIRVDFDRKHCDQPGYQKKWDVVLCNYKTGGVGLNFTGATHMVICDEEWNPGKNEQAWKRIKRIGQTEETFVHILRLRKTIDTWFAALLDEKNEMVQTFNDNVDTLYQKLLDDLKGGEFL